MQEEDKFKSNCTYTLENLVIPELNLMVSNGVLSRVVFNSLTYKKARERLEKEEPLSMIEKFIDHQEIWSRFLPFRFTGDQSLHNMNWVKDNASVLIHGIDDETRTAINDVMVTLDIGKHVRKMFIDSLINVGKTLLKITLRYIEANWRHVSEGNTTIPIGDKLINYDIKLYVSPDSKYKVDTGYWSTALTV